MDEKKTGVTEQRNSCRNMGEHPLTHWHSALTTGKCLVTFRKINQTTHPPSKKIPCNPSKKFIHAVGSLSARRNKHFILILRSEQATYFDARSKPIFIGKSATAQTCKNNCLNLMFSGFHVFLSTVQETQNIYCASRREVLIRSTSI